MIDPELQIDPNVASGFGRTELEAWIDAFEHVARHYNVPFSPRGALQLGRALEGDDAATQIGRLARKLGLRVRQAWLARRARQRPTVAPSIPMAAAAARCRTKVRATR